MARLLTKLRLDEVSAVDAGAGENCEILLMKRHSDAVAKATAALETSVASILGCDDDDATKRDALAETFTQFQMYLDREITGKSLGKGVLERETRRIRKGFEEMLKVDDDGEDIAKARHIGAHHLASAVTEHFLDLLHHRRRHLGIEKGAQPGKDSTVSTLESILKDFGPVKLCKHIADTGRSPVGEHELVMSLSQHVGGDVAFSKLYESEKSVRRACQLAKAAEFSVFDIKPVVVGTPGEMHAAVDDTEQSAVLRAHEEIVRIGREKFPFLPADQQFARVFEDKNYAALAAQAHRRPGATTIYAMPGSAAPGRGAYTKADPAPNTDTAYAALLAKAREHQAAHPELTEAQAFAKIYADRANVELAKRERVESAPR